MTNLLHILKPHGLLSISTPQDPHDLVELLFSFLSPLILF